MSARRGGVLKLAELCEAIPAKKLVELAGEAPLIFRVLRSWQAAENCGDTTTLQWLQRAKTLLEGFFGNEKDSILAWAMHSDGAKGKQYPLCRTAIVHQGQEVLCAVVFAPLKACDTHKKNPPAIQVVFLRAKRFADGKSRGLGRLMVEALQAHVGGRLGQADANPIDYSPAFSHQQVLRASVMRVAIPFWEGVGLVPMKNAAATNPWASAHDSSLYLFGKRAEATADYGRCLEGEDALEGAVADVRQYWISGKPLRAPPVSVVKAPKRLPKPPSTPTAIPPTNSNGKRLNAGTGDVLPPNPASAPMPGMRIVQLAAVQSMGGGRQAAAAVQGIGAGRPESVPSTAAQTPGAGLAKHVHARKQKPAVRKVLAQPAPAPAQPLTLAPPPAQPKFRFGAKVPQRQSQPPSEVRPTAQPAAQLVGEPEVWPNDRAQAQAPVWEHPVAKVHGSAQPHGGTAIMSRLWPTVVIKEETAELQRTGPIDVHPPPAAEHLPTQPLSPLEPQVQDITMEVEPAVSELLEQEDQSQQEQKEGQEHVAMPLVVGLGLGQTGALDREMVTPGDTHTLAFEEGYAVAQAAAAAQAAVTAQAAAQQLQNMINSHAQEIHATKLAYSHTLLQQQFTAQRELVKMANKLEAAELEKADLMKVLDRHAGKVLPAELEEWMRLMRVDLLDNVKRGVTKEEHREKLLTAYVKWRSVGDQRPATTQFFAEALEAAAPPQQALQAGSGMDEGDGGVEVVKPQQVLVSGNYYKVCQVLYPEIHTKGHPIPSPAALYAQQAEARQAWAVLCEARRAPTLAAGVDTLREFSKQTRRLKQSQPQPLLEELKHWLVQPQQVPNGAVLSVAEGAQTWQ